MSETCRDCGYPGPRALRRWRPSQTKPWSVYLLCRKCHARKSASVRDAAQRANLAAIQARVSARFTRAVEKKTQAADFRHGRTLAYPPGPTRQTGAQQ
jgi:hypothetical protein